MPKFQHGEDNRLVWMQHNFRMGHFAWHTTLRDLCAAVSWHAKAILFIQRYLYATVIPVYCRHCQLTCQDGFICSTLAACQGHNCVPLSVNMPRRFRLFNVSCMPLSYLCDAVSQHVKMVSFVQRLSQFVILLLQINHLGFQLATLLLQTLSPKYHRPCEIDCTAVMQLVFQ